MVADKILTLSFLQNFYLSNIRKSNKNTFSLNKVKENNFYYHSRYCNYQINNLIFFFKDDFNNKKSDSRHNFYFLINYFNSFFKCLSRFLKKDYKINSFSKILFLAFHRKSNIIMKYLSKKFNFSYLSSFLPPVITNNQFKLTDFYKSGLSFQFYINSSHIFMCVFILSKELDFNIISHIRKKNLLLFSVTTQIKLIEKSDINFPLSADNLDSLYSAIIFVNLLLKS